MICGIKKDNGLCAAKTTTIIGTDVAIDVGSCVSFVRRNNLYKKKPVSLVSLA